MELAKKNFSTRMKKLALKISDDNLFLLASSISYYSALALAPFILILLWIAALLGHSIQGQIINHAYENFSPEVGDMIKLVFQNITEGVNIGSISGVIGLMVLLWTCSLVFVQFRYSFDIIYGYYFHPDFKKTTLQTIKERFFAMFAVLAGILLLMASFTVTAIIEYLWGRTINWPGTYRILVFALNFIIYLILFTGLHKFVPTRRQKLKNALKIAALTSVFFIIGNWGMSYYLKEMASRSVYGAAGTLLIFLIWAYYSAFIIFLSVEVFVYLKKIGRVKS
jgi:membrane protein